jgi:DNA-binding NtrC family response regulator
MVVDDDRNVVESFTELFRDRYRVLGAYNGAEAIRLLKEQEVDLAFLDYRLPGENGLEVLQSIQAVDPDLDTVIITAHGSFETIIQSMALGAYDYIEKPLDIDKVNLVAQRALESRKMKHYVKAVREDQIRTYDLARVIGKSQMMHEVFKAIGRLVNNDVTVLIQGESGTGKELIARALHYNSPRRDEPFMAVNCSGLPESLLENELFGHDPQAFTGATTRKAGRFEAAGEGTVFLDEIGDMPVTTQTKLLRVLQEREFQRLGGVKSIRLKARVTAATNKDLGEEIRRGRFREDLFYRINVASIQVPPLRERIEDIPPLVEHFLSVTAHRLNKTLRGISEDALRILTRYPWPGNVRELENVMTTLGINTQSGIIRADDIPRYISTGTQPDGDLFDEFIGSFLSRYGGETGLLSFLTGQLESRLLRRLAELTGNNKTAMAERLGISRVTLQKKLTCRPPHRGPAPGTAPGAAGAGPQP